MRRGNGVVLARAFGEVLSIFPRGSEFGGGLDVCTCGSCQGKSVSRCQALGVGHSGQVGKKGKEKKSQRCDSGPGLAQACAPSHGLAWVRSGPTCTRNSFTSSHPLFPQNPKSENHPRRFLPAWAPRLCSFLLVACDCDRYHSRACF